MTGPVTASLKAYSVQADEHGCVRFAASNVVARREGANVLDSEFEFVSCRRAPEFDRYSPGPVPELALWESGWSFLCEVCDMRQAREGTGAVVGSRFLCEDCVELANTPPTHSSPLGGGGPSPQAMVEGVIHGDQT